MYKRLILTMVAVLFSVSAYGITLDNLREDLAVKFNQTVRDLKDIFKNTKSEVDKTESDVNKTYEIALELKEQSTYPENNPTVLDHGRVDPVSCGKGQTLSWDKSKKVWTCKNVKTLNDCYPIKGEERVCDELGNCKCQQVGEYKYGGQYWTSCKNDIERSSNNICNFVNSETKISYEVDKTLCSDLPAEKYQACGKRGYRSSCSCPNNYEYYYDRSTSISYCRFNLNTVNQNDDMNLVYNGRLIMWGTITKDYWKGSCKVYTKKMTVDYNPEAISSIKLHKVEFKDYMWLRVNGKQVYAGPDNQAALSKVNSPSTGLITFEDGKYNACSRGTRWSKSLNVDITRFFKPGVNTIEMDTVLDASGDAYIELLFNKKSINEFYQVPICTR